MSLICLDSSLNFSDVHTNIIIAVCMRSRLAVSAPSRTSCPQGLIGISVMLSATLNLDFAPIKDCTYTGIFAEGNATVTWTTDSDHGIFSFGARTGEWRHRS